MVLVEEVLQRQVCKLSLMERLSFVFMAVCVKCGRISCSKIMPTGIYTVFF